MKTLVFVVLELLVVEVQAAAQLAAVDGDVVAVLPEIVEYSAVALLEFVAEVLAVAQLDLVRNFGIVHHYVADHYTHYSLAFLTAASFDAVFVFAGPWQICMALSRNWVPFDCS